MKYETNICDGIDVPEKIIKEFEKRYEVSIKNEKDLNEKLSEEFEEFCSEYLAECNGKMVDEDIAVFLCSMTTCFVAIGGGYPVEGYIEFEDEGNKYSVVAFAWTSDLGDKRPLNMIAYRVKDK